MPSIVAVIPAAGRAIRLGDAVEGSKEVVEVGGAPVTAHLLHRLQLAGIDTVVIALRSGKWDIPAALQPYREDTTISYVVLEESPSAAHSVAAAMPMAADRLVALGFPDILFHPIDAYRRLLERQRSTSADIVMGLFPSGDAESVDMVELDAENRPRRLVIKQPDQGLRYSWAVAVWTPRFSRHFADFTASAFANGHELHVGDAIQAALDGGFEAEALIFEDGGYLDIGTPESLEEARRLFVEHPNLGDASSDSKPAA